MKHLFTLACWLLLLAGATPAQAQRLAAGQDFTLSIHPDGTLWAWGTNSYGQLGLGSPLAVGNFPYQAAPQQVGTASTWVSVSAGSNHAAALRADGTLWVWGYNGFGQLGLGTSTGFQYSPVQVGTATWLSVNAGHNCTLAIRADGTLWAWGYNGYGETGLGTASNTNQPTPAQVGTATTWQRVSASGGHALALRTDGTLWAWGYNADGQLGTGTTSTLASPTQVGTASNWLRVSASYSHSLAVRQDGTLWAWGRNYNGQLGTGTTTDQLTPTQVGPASTWQQVAAGSGFSLALRADGSLWAWGHNRYGQLGTGPTATDQLTPVPVGAATTWVGLSAGLSHAVALRQDNSVWAWGGKYIGQLGAGVGGPQLLPGQLASVPAWASLTVGSVSALGIRTDGTLWGWGANAGGQLGTGTTTDQDVPAPAGLATWQQVETNGGVTLGIRPDGSLWAWGDNSYGQLGTGAALSTSTATPVRVGTGTTWQTVVLGSSHVLALQTDGSLWAWGSNQFGQLGTGSPATLEATPVRVGTATWLSIGGGLLHSVAVRQDGSLWAWGHNSSGQLGTGANAPATTAIPIRVGTGTTWRSVSGGPFYNLALKTDGTLWAWGHSLYGELGVGNPGDDVFTPTQVGTATTWRYAKAGGVSSLAIRQDNTLWVWGSNTYGKLGLGTTLDQLAPVQQGPATWQSAGLGLYFGAGIRTNGTLWSWGYNDYGQLGNGLPGSATPVFIANGGAALAALAADPAVAWHLAPNPAHDRVQLLGLPAGPVAGQLFDAQGRLARTIHAPELDLRNLAPGLYLLRTTAGTTTRTLRLVVE